MLGLLVSILKVFCLFWLVVTSAILIFWVTIPKPDVDALFTPGSMRIKDAFTLGVVQAILEMNLRLPVTAKVGSAAAVSSRNQIDDELGVPIQAMECDMLKMEIDSGEVAALRWYAREKKMFPVNSTKSQTSH